MNYLKRKLLGHVFMCGGGEGGGGGLTDSQTDQALANFDTQQAGEKFQAKTLQRPVVRPRHSEARCLL